MGPAFLHHSSRRGFQLSHIFTVLIGSFVMTGCGRHTKTAVTLRDSTVARATFTQDGSIKLPVGYREWSHVGTSVKFKGINVLDGTPIKTPEVLDAYVEPGAMSAFQKTAKWPDGAQIVKEYSTVQLGDGGDEQTRISNTSMGNGISEAHYDGLGMMVKDSKRFGGAPGNWGYFSFGHKLPPYDSTARVRVLPRATCFGHRLCSVTCAYRAGRKN